MYNRLDFIKKMVGVMEDVILTIEAQEREAVDPELSIIRELAEQMLQEIDALDE